MPFLVILKRFEVWLLLALVAGLIAFALQPPPEPESNQDRPEPPAVTTNLPPLGSPAEGSDTPVVPSAPFAIQEVRVTPSSGGHIVETLISGRAPGDKDLALDQETVRATTADGEPLPLFFEPFRERPVLLVSADSTASLRWWCPASAPTSLWIEIDNVRLQAEVP